MDEQYKIAKVVVDDDRLTLNERFVLLKVLLSDKPYAFSPFHLKKETGIGDKFFDRMMTKFENMGYIIGRHKGGVGFSLVLYQINIAHILANKTKMQKAVKKKNFERAYEPKRIQYIDVTPVQYFDELDNLKEPEIEVPAVINGVPVED